MLIQSVDQLGNQGDVVEVKRGYAMNYLLPQGLATIATDHHARMIEKHRSRLMELQKEKIGKLKDLATAITKQSINIEANANDDGHGTDPETIDLVGRSSAAGEGATAEGAVRSLLVDLASLLGRRRHESP